LVGTALALGCQSADPETGGETHFLSCANDAVCTSRLGEAYACLDGYCRVPTPPPAAPNDDPDAGDRPDAATPSCPDSGVGANEVVILGDTFFAATHEITTELERLGAESGVLTADEHYRDYSRLVQNALALVSNGIADQYDGAVAEGAVRVVIMNGGGADALVGSCETIDQDCPVVVEAANAATALLAQMAEDGVIDVVYAFYPDALDAPTREKLDAMRPLIRVACDEAATRCHWLDLRETFEGRYDDYIGADGYNPTTAGSEAAATAIWTLMQRNCIAQ
jgi:hypothetical protein